LKVLLLGREDPLVSAGGEPVGPPVQVEDERERGVGHLFNTVAGHVAHGDPEVGGGTHVDVVVVDADAHDQFQSLELEQVLPAEGDGVVEEGGVGLVEHLLVDLVGRLGVAEGHRGDVLEDGHLDGAVAAVQEGD